MPAAEGAATALVAPPKVPANSGATETTLAATCARLVVATATDAGRVSGYPGCGCHHDDRHLPRLRPARRASTPVW